MLSYILPPGRLTGKHGGLQSATICFRDPYGKKVPARRDLYRVVHSNKAPVYEIGNEAEWAESLG